MKNAISILVLTMALLPSLAFGEIETEIVAMKDATLLGELPGEQANGSGQHFFAGRNAVGGPYRSVLAFDIAGNIPDGSTIVSATLTIHLSRTIVGPQPHTLHVVTKDWGEGPSDPPDNEGFGTDPLPGDCTWLHTFYPDEFWDNPGGDFSPVVSGSQSIGDLGFYSFSDAQMATDVQFWLDNPDQNYGWLLYGNEDSYPTAKRFDSRENPEPSVRPVLTVTYEEEPTPVDQSTWGKIKVLY